jgi:leukotriene-A4 hydrolase
MPIKLVSGLALCYPEVFAQPGIAVAFLEKLQSYLPLPSDLTFHLGQLYGVSSTSNAEVRLRFYGVALQDATSPAAQHFAVEAAKWVIGDDGTGIIKGRMKFCRPTFRAIWKVDEDLAVKTFIKAKNSFHPIARKLIEKVRVFYSWAQKKSC